MFRAIPHYNNINKFKLHILTKIFNYKLVKEFNILTNYIIMYYYKTTYIFEKNIKKIKPLMFKNSSLFEVIIPDTVESIGKQAFSNCTRLKNVLIPKSVKSIGYSAFNFCISLKKIFIPEKVKNIKYRTFAYCLNLEEIFLLGENKNKYLLDIAIHEKAFFICRKLKTIYTNRIFFSTDKNLPFVNIYKIYII